MSACMPEDAARLAALLSAAAPRAGGTRVLAIDGRSGSGKSTLAAAVAARTGAPVVSMEQLYGGWDGLRDGIRRLVQDVLLPLAAGERVCAPRYDWSGACWLDPQPLGAPDTLVVEGVGSGALDAAPHLAVLAWIELPEAIRRERAMERDPGIYDGHWERWRAQEDAYLLTDGTRERAQVILPFGGSG